MKKAIGANPALATFTTILKRAGFVAAAALLGIVTWGLLSSLATLAMSGSFADEAANQAGRDGARYALSIGGSLGAVLGAWFRTRGPHVTAPNVAGWGLAAVLTLFFVVASLGAT